MKNELNFFGILILLVVVVLCACVSGAQSGDIEIIRRGAGTALGTVAATASVTENRETGIIEGDTGKYGFIEGIPVSRVTTGKKPPKDQAKAKHTIPSDAAEKAYANAVFELIRQVKAKGGNGVTEVVSDVVRNYDPDTGIETVDVSVSAEAVRL